MSIREHTCRGDGESLGIPPALPSAPTPPPPTPPPPRLLGASERGVSVSAKPVAMFGKKCVPTTVPRAASIRQHTSAYVRRTAYVSTRQEKTAYVSIRACQRLGAPRVAASNGMTAGVGPSPPRIHTLPPPDHNGADTRRSCTPRSVSICTFCTSQARKTE